MSKYDMLLNYFNRFANDFPSIMCLANNPVTDIEFDDRENGGWFFKYISISRKAQCNCTFVWRIGSISPSIDTVISSLFWGGEEHCFAGIPASRCTGVMNSHPIHAGCRFDTFNNYATSVPVHNQQAHSIFGPITLNYYFRFSITNREVCLSFRFPELSSQRSYGKNNCRNGREGRCPTTESAYPTAETKSASFACLAGANTYYSKIKKPKGYKGSHPCSTYNSNKNNFFSAKHYHAPANDAELSSTIINSLARAAA